MESLREFYRIGYGPSSSHTMAPRRAGELFKSKNLSADAFRVTLYGSLASTGKGHLTDKALYDAFSPSKVEIIWKPEIILPIHPNGMKFESLDSNGNVISNWVVYSIGGGALRDEDSKIEKVNVYKLTRMSDILEWADRNGRTFWEYVEECEGKDIWDYLKEVWSVMKDAIKRGLDSEGALPGGLNLPRKASSYYIKAINFNGALQKIDLIFAYALAVAEENAGGGKVVTAPTCGSCGVLPAVLYLLQETYNFSDSKILKALATAGLIGNIVKENASISGAEVGCQGEIGTACAMASASATQLLGGTPAQIEYSAEIGLEHHLGLTCDPVGGLVQIPCIERNALAASRALDSAIYAILSDGRHRISFDEVVDTMKHTGHDLPSLYKETSKGGLAKFADATR